MSSLMSFFLFKCLYFCFLLFLREGALSFSCFENINNTESKCQFLSTFCIVVFRGNNLSWYIKHFVCSSAYWSSAGVIVSCWSPTLTYLTNDDNNTVLPGSFSRWRRCKICPCASKATYHIAPSLSQSLESRLPPLSEIQWCSGKRSVCYL